MRGRPGLAPAGEGLDDDPASTAAWARQTSIERCLRWIIGWRRDRQEFACAREAGHACRRGEQAVVADAVEAGRQKVEQEAAKFSCRSANRAATAEVNGSLRRGRSHRCCLSQAHTACQESGIEHRCTKINHPWTNGQVERMDRTIKEATVQPFSDITTTVTLS